MTLSDDEVEVVIKYRADKAQEEHRLKQKQIYDSCEHSWEFQFSNYKSYYYKCTKCGLQSVR